MKCSSCRSVAYAVPKASQLNSFTQVALSVNEIAGKHCVLAKKINFGLLYSKKININDYFSIPYQIYGEIAVQKRWERHFLNIHRTYFLHCLLFELFVIISSCSLRMTSIGLKFLPYSSTKKSRKSTNANEKC